MQNLLKKGAGLALVFLTLALTVNVALAQEDSGKLRVVTKTVEPFVMSDSYRGFSVDLWDAMMKELGMNYEFYRVTSVQGMLDAVQNGEADAGMAAITINSAREEIVDFSHPFYDSGLQILAPFKEEGAGLTFAMFIPILKVLAAVVVLMLISAHLMWLFERKNNSDFDKGYLKGVWDGFWWSAVTVTTVGYGDKAPKKVPGRLIGLLWMFAGLFILAYFTSSITSALTVRQLQSTINGPEDLPGKIVATVEDTAPQRYLSSINLKLALYPSIDKAYAAVIAGQADAMVYDAPVLQYFAANEGSGLVKTVGKVFKPEGYGVAFPKGSELRGQVNIALLKLKESGAYEEIYNEWFGGQ